MELTDEVIDYLELYGGCNNELSEGAQQATPLPLLTYIFVENRQLLLQTAFDVRTCASSRLL